MKRSLWRITGDAMLSAGPADRESLIFAMMPHVPPNRASAETRRKREKVAASRGHNVYQQGQHGGQKDQYEVGARHVATSALIKALRSGTWIQLPDGRIALRGWSK